MMLNQQAIDVDLIQLIQALERLGLFLREQLAQNPSEGNVLEAIIVVANTKRELEGNRPDKAITVLQKGDQALANFARYIDLDIIADVARGEF